MSCCGTASASASRRSSCGRSGPGSRKSACCARSGSSASACGRASAYNFADRGEGGTMHRRTLLKTTVMGAAVAGFPLPLRAQPKTIKIAAIHTVTGALAEPGQACRMAAQIAVDHVNGSGGIKSMGGAKLELMLGDTQTKPDVARTEAERLINAGAQLLLGTVNSGDTAAIVPVAQLRRGPLIVYIEVSVQLRSNVARTRTRG